MGCPLLALSSMFVHYIQKRGLFCEMRKVIQMALRVLKSFFIDIASSMFLNFALCHWFWGWHYSWFLTILYKCSYKNDRNLDQQIVLIKNEFHLSMESRKIKQLKSLGWILEKIITMLLERNFIRTQSLRLGGVKF